MPDNQMTESEIMKALEIHADNEAGCSECPIYRSDTGDTCAYELAQNALDLINRKNEQLAEKDAEIKRLKEATMIWVPARSGGKTRFLVKKYNAVRAEAIKEFAAIVKFKVEEPWLYGKNAICRKLDQIAKEMGVEL